MNEPLSTPSSPVRVETGLGALLLHPQRFADIGALAPPAPDDAPADRLRRFFERVAAREGAHSTAATAPRLDAATTAALSDDDLERLAEAYLTFPESEPEPASPGDAAYAPAASGEAPAESATQRLDRRLRAVHERQLDDLRATHDALRERYAESLSDALAELERQAEALRGAVAGIDTTARSAPAVADDAPAGREERTWRLQHDAVELARGGARLTARSALLLAALTEGATGFARRFADTAAPDVRTASRRATLLAGLAAVLAGGATVLAGAALLQERDNARQVERIAEVVMTAQREQTAALAATRSEIGTRLGEIADRQSSASAATAAIHRAVVAALPPVAAGDTVPAAHSPAKPASTTRNSKRKVAR